MKQPYNAALYMRLSHDDEKYGDSVSIETQRTILQQFARDQMLHVSGEYVDDGWSGTNFERPDFKRMIEDIDAGIINCVVVKDLSRFGREHVMMDYYLEFLFPEKHVRFIAVTDNEDTEKGLSDFVPFKNLFNEWYAKDTSRKVKAALKAKHLNGEHTFTYAPLGYKRAEDGSNALVPDEETRWIVEKIFDMAISGAGAAKIARALRREKVPTPGYLNYKRYGKFAHIHANAPEEHSYAWQISTVKRILNDEVYIGNSVHNRMSTISYKNRKNERKPETEWYTVKNTHEGIVPEEVFRQAQELIQSRRRPQKDGTTQIFSGLLKCPDCGWTMSYATNKQGKEPYGYFTCTTHRMYGKMNNACTCHYVRYDVLYVYVLSRIQYWVKRVEEDEEHLLEMLLKAGDQEHAAATKKQTTELKKAEKRKAELDSMFAKMYEDWASGRITESNFDMLTKKYQSEQETVEQKIQALKAALAEEKETVENAEKWIALIKECGKPTELTAELLNTLIEKILVHEAWKDETHTRHQEIEIVYCRVYNDV